MRSLSKESKEVIIHVLIAIFGGIIISLILSNFRFYVFDSNWDNKIMTWYPIISLLCIYIFSSTMNSTAYSIKLIAVLSFVIFSLMTYQVLKGLGVAVIISVIIDPDYTSKNILAVFIYLGIVIYFLNIARRNGLQKRRKMNTKL